MHNFYYYYEYKMTTSFNILGYPEFGYYLNQTGRPMIYSCSWPVYQIYAGIQVSIIKISKFF